VYIGWCWRRNSPWLAGRFRQVDAWRTECDHAMGNVRGLVEQYKLLADNLQVGLASLLCCGLTFCSASPNLPSISSCHSLHSLHSHPLTRAAAAAQDGIVFYTNLQDAINGVMCECQDYAMSRSLQQTDMRGAMAAEEQRRQTAEQVGAAVVVRLLGVRTTERVCACAWQSECEAERKVHDTNMPRVTDAAAEPPSLLQTCIRGGVRM
jgi:hypothetical protein